MKINNWNLFNESKEDFGGKNIKDVKFCAEKIYDICSEYFDKELSIKDINVIDTAVKEYTDPESKYYIILPWIKEYFFKNDKDKFKELDKFYNGYGKSLRNFSEQSNNYDKTLKEIMNNSNIEVNDKNFNIMDKAYQHTLDYYEYIDDFDSKNWDQHWSLIGFDDGDIILSLSDSVDREIFWEYVKKHNNDLYNTIRDDYEISENVKNWKQFNECSTTDIRRRTIKIIFECETK